MYTTPPPKWHESRNGDVLISRRGATAWDKRLAYPSAPHYKTLAYFDFTEKWGDRIPPAPVIGNPVSSVSGERLYNALTTEGLGGFFDDVASAFKTATQWVGHRVLPRPAYKFVAKGVRYAGAASPVSALLTARQRAKAFGLSGRESSQFETVAKVTRGVAAAAAVVVAAPYAAPYVLPGLKYAGSGIVKGGSVIGSAALSALRGTGKALVAAPETLGRVIGGVVGGVGAAGGSFTKGYREAGGEPINITPTEVGQAAGSVIREIDEDRGSQGSIPTPSNKLPINSGPKSPAPLNEESPASSHDSTKSPALDGKFWLIAGGVALTAIVLSKSSTLRLRRRHA